MTSFLQECILQSHNKLVYYTRKCQKCSCNFDAILFPSFLCHPRQSIIVLSRSRRYIADACNAYNYSRNALWGLGGGLAWLQSCHWFLMDVMPQSWCGLQGGQATIRKGTEGCTVKQVTEWEGKNDLFTVRPEFHPQYNKYIQYFILVFIYTKLPLY